MARHTLRAAPDTVRVSAFDASFPPVLTIAPGDSVAFETLDARWSIEPHPQPDGTPGRRFAPLDDERDNGHALCGPVYIDGARPGMVLGVEIGPIIPGPWGWTSGGGWANGINERVGAGANALQLDWTLDAEAGTGMNQFGHRITIDPFFGVMGMP